MMSTRRFGTAAFAAARGFTRSVLHGPSRPRWNALRRVTRAHSAAATHCPCTVGVRHFSTTEQPQHPLTQALHKFNNVVRSADGDTQDEFGHSAMEAASLDVLLSISVAPQLWVPIVRGSIFVGNNTTPEARGLHYYSFTSEEKGKEFLAKQATDRQAELTLVPRSGLMIASMVAHTAETVRKGDSEPPPVWLHLDAGDPVGLDLDPSWTTAPLSSAVEAHTVHAIIHQLTNQSKKGETVDEEMFTTLMQSLRRFKFGVVSCRPKDLSRLAELGGDVLGTLLPPKADSEDAKPTRVTMLFTHPVRARQFLHHHGRAAFASRDRELFEVEVTGFQGSDLFPMLLSPENKDELVMAHTLLINPPPIELVNQEQQDTVFYSRVLESVGEDVLQRLHTVCLMDESGAWIRDALERGLWDEPTADNDSPKQA